jgi:5'(3')-deoxyribonucleotidase
MNVSSSSGKRIIAVDIDEVLAYFIPSLAEFHNDSASSSGGVVLTAESFVSYNFVEVWGGSVTETNAKMEAFFVSDHFHRISPIEKAYEALVTLKETYDLHIITARQLKMQKVTEDWVEKHYPGIFTTLHFGNHYRCVIKEKWEKKGEWIVVARCGLERSVQCSAV